MYRLTFRPYKIMETEIEGRIVDGSGATRERIEEKKGEHKIHKSNELGARNWTGTIITHHRQDQATRLAIVGFHSQACAAGLGLVVRREVVEAEAEAEGHPRRGHPMRHEERRSPPVTGQLAHGILPISDSLHQQRQEQRPIIESGIRGL